ncbi:MAG: hypothetical protein ACLFV8_12645 [Alphaproteobacteria bacterium]
MRRFRSFILFLISFIAVFAAVRFWQEADYGAEARDSAAAVNEPAREVAFVANAVAGTVSLIDVAERKVIGTLNAVPDGKRAGFFRDPVQYFAQGFVERRGGKNYAQDTDLSRDGTVLFVSRGHLGDVAAFDIATGGILWRTPIRGVRADHMAISPDGRRLFVSALIRGGDVVEVLDTESGARLGRFKTGTWPHDVHVSEDGKRVYSASLGDMTKSVDERGRDENAYVITVADAETLEIIQTYPFHTGIRPFQVARNGRVMYAQLSNEHALAALDLELSAYTGLLSLPVAEGVSEHDWDFEAPHHGLALSEDGTTLCAAGRASDYAAIVETEGSKAKGAFPLSDSPSWPADDATVETNGLRLKGTVPAGDAPSWAAFAGDGICLLANNRSDDVSFISVDGMNEIARIPAGRGPKHITVGRVPEGVLDKVRAR